MNSLTKLEVDAQNAMARIKAGCASQDDLNIVQIYLAQFNKKAGNAGKRKIKPTGK